MDIKAGIEDVKEELEMNEEEENVNYFDDQEDLDTEEHELKPDAEFIEISKSKKMKLNLGPRGSYNVQKSSKESYPNSFLQNVDNTIDYTRIEDLEKRLIPNPTTPQQLRINRSVSGQINLEKARIEVLK